MIRVNGVWNRSLMTVVSIGCGLSMTSGWSAAEPPPLTTTSFLPGDAVSAPGAGRQLSPELAAGSGQYLLVWVDERASMVDIVTFTGGPTYHPYAGSKWDIYAARVDLAGNLLDQTPIVVSQELKNQAEPDVAWNGQNWLVTWAGQAGIECCADVNIYAARVSPDGEVLDVPSIVVDRDSSNSDLRWPTVGSDGTNWVVAWRDLDGGIFTIDGTRIAPDGTILDPGGVFLRHDTQNSYPVKPDIVWAGDEYLLTWEEGSGGIKAQRVGADLQRVGGVIGVNASYWTGYESRVATNGTDFLITWRSEPPGQTTELAGARIAHDGTVLDTPPLLLTQAVPEWIVDPSVAWDGTNWVVAFGRGSNPIVDVFAIRVSPGGFILDYDTNALPITTAPELQWETTIAGIPGGGGTFVAWRDHRYTPTLYGAHGDIFGTTLAPDGSAGADACMALGAPRQTLLEIVPDNSGFLAVYRSETSPETRILAQRLDASGLAIDPEPVVVAASARGFTNPSAAWNGSMYLVVWEDRFANRTFGRRLNPDLSPIDALPIDIMPGNMPDVAVIGDLFLTVSSWEEPHEVRGAYGVRVRGSDGAVLDATPRLFSSGYAVFPSVAAFGDRWMTAWQSHPTHDDPNSSAKGNFVDLTGNAGSWFYVDLDATRPVIATGPDHGIVVFSGDTGPGLHDDIFARRVQLDGTFLDADRGIQVTSVLFSQHEPAAAWDGTEYVTAFADLRDSDADGSFMGELYGARIAADGGVMDPDGFPVATAPVPELFPAVGGRDGSFLMGGSIFRPEQGYANYRVGLRSVGAAVGVEPEGPGHLVPTAVSANPFQEAVEIRLQVGGPGRDASVMIVDASGRRVRNLFTGSTSGYVMRVVWDGRSDSGLEVGPGIYFVRGRIGSERVQARLVRLR